MTPSSHATVCARVGNRTRRRREHHHLGRRPHRPSPAITTNTMCELPAARAPSTRRSRSPLTTAQRSLPPSIPWTTPPDSTTQYVIQEGPQPFVLDGLTGSVKYLHLMESFRSTQDHHRAGNFCRCQLGWNHRGGARLPATTPFMAIGDSFWEGDAAPEQCSEYDRYFCGGMNWQTINLGDGGTGFIGTVAGRLNFQDRIAPPAEAWRVSLAATAAARTPSALSTMAVTSTTAAARLQCESNRDPNRPQCAGQCHVGRRNVCGGTRRYFDAADHRRTRRLRVRP